MDFDLASELELARMLRPRSIAVVGGQAAERVAEQCDRLSFDGEVWPVHPRRSVVAGHRAVATLDDLPGVPDAAFIGVNRSATIDAVAALARIGAGGAVCYASGFSEAEGGAALQDALLEAAGTMPVIGPNCYGFVNYLDGVPLWPDEHGGAPVQRGVAILAQSSNLAVNLSMQGRSLPIAYLATAGNQAQLSQAAIGLQLLADERVTALGMHIEGFTDLEGWQALAARSRALRKPIVALKAGRSELAQSLTKSHTASLAGSEAGAAALLARLGIAQVSGLLEFVEALKFLHYSGPLPGRRLASLSCSGGEAALVADAAAGRRLEFPPLAPAQTEALRGVLGPRVHLSNPLDYQTYIWGDSSAMTATFAAMLDGGFDLACLIFDPPRTDRCDAAAWRPAADAWIAAVRRTDGRGAVIATMPELLTETQAGGFIAAGITPLCGLDAALAAFEAAADIADYWSSPLPEPLWPAPATAGPAEQVNEWEAKRILATHGLAAPRRRLAANPQEAAAGAAAIGFPVVLKGLGHAHKSDRGAVRLGLETPEAVQAATQMMDAPEGWLVEAQIDDAVAELLLGVVADPAHGLVLTLGAGGVWTELLADTASLILPVRDADILNALRGLRIWPLLAGFRGRPAADVDALVAAAQALARCAAAVDGLVELEVNPYLARPKGGVAVDALLRLSSYYVDKLRLAGELADGGSDE